MKSIWFEYWGGMVDVKIVHRIPRKGRYLCSDDSGEWFDESVNYYDISEEYIVAVPDADMPW